MNRALMHEDLARAAKLFHAASNVSRLKLLTHLVAHESNVTNLARLTQLPLSTVSQQLQLLRSVGCVRSRRVGKELRYSIGSGHVRTLLEVGVSLARSNHSNLPP